MADDWLTGRLVHGLNIFIVGLSSEWVPVTTYSQQRSLAKRALNHLNADSTFVHGRKMHVGIHWIAFAEYSQMSTHLLGFQSFLTFIVLFCIDKIYHQQYKG